MRIDGWQSAAGTARAAWIRGAAWCALTLSPAGTGGLAAALWAVAGALLLRLATLAAPGVAVIARVTGIPRA